LFLHLGNDQAISGDKVIAIINLEGYEAETARTLMEKARQENRLTRISSGDKQKSLVVCDDQLYISPISSHTLYKRSSYNRQEV
jgi:extracellular matrix regulatory protein B